MIKEEIIISENIEELSREFTNLLMKIANEHPHVNIALSGGNTPKAIFDYMAANCADTLPWHKISFYWGDERCVLPHDAMSNYNMTREHLFDKVPSIKPDSIFRILGENEPEAEAERYSNLLNEKLPNRNGFPVFDVVLLGLGDDGHTVSIFPYQIDLWDAQTPCVVATHPESGMKRVSITGGVVNNARYAIFLVTGMGKAEKVRDIIKDKDKFKSTFPAAKVSPSDGFLYWLLNKEASCLLE